MSELTPHEPNEDEDFFDNDEDWAADPKRMGFLDHLEELRWTLIKPLAVFAVTFIVVMVFVKDVSELLTWPLMQIEGAMMEGGYVVGSDAGEGEEGKDGFRGLATRNPMGVYSAMLQIGFIFSFCTAFPVLLFYGAKFIAPALTRKEKALLLPGSIGVFILFLLGSTFSFFLLLPKTLAITIWFNRLLGWELIWSPDSYFNFMIWLVIGMGVAFEFPLVVIILVYLRILSVEQLRKSRRIAILIFLVTAAFLTPPDPFTQVMVAGPMVLLYELSIWVARIIEKKRAKEDQAFYSDDDDDDHYGAEDEYGGEIERE